MLRQHLKSKVEVGLFQEAALDTYVGSGEMELDTVQRVGSMGSVVGHWHVEVTPLGQLVLHVREGRKRREEDSRWGSTLPERKELQWEWLLRLLLVMMIGHF